MAVAGLKAPKVPLKPKPELTLDSDGLAPPNPIAELGYYDVDVALTVALVFLNAEETVPRGETRENSDPLKLLPRMPTPAEIIESAPIVFNALRDASPSIFIDSIF